MTSLANSSRRVKPFLRLSSLFFCLFVSLWCLVAILLFLGNPALTLFKRMYRYILRSFYTSPLPSDFLVLCYSMIPFQPFMPGTLSPLPRTASLLGLACDSKLTSTNERIHVICVFLGLGYISQDDCSQFHSFTCEIYNWVFLNGWVNVSLLEYRTYLFSFHSKTMV